MSFISEELCQVLFSYSKFEYYSDSQTSEYELPLTFMDDIKQEFGSSKSTEMPTTKFNCCSFCKNHNEIFPKKGHGCLLRHCPCVLCDLTRKVQKATRLKQRLWRYQKHRLRECIDDPSFKIDSGIIDSEYRINCPVCDKCRNHNHLTKKKNHKCPYLVCDCELCSLIFNRLEILKLQQRVRRSKITAKLIVEPSSPGSTSRDSSGSPPLPALLSDNLIDFDHLISIMKVTKNEDIKDTADIDAQGSFYKPEDFDMENIITKTEYSIDEPVEDDIVYLKTVTNDSKVNLVDTSSENRLSPPPLIPMLSYSDIKDEDLPRNCYEQLYVDFSESSLQIDEASCHFNDSDDKSNMQHSQFHSESYDSNSSNKEFQMSHINIKSVMSFNGANALDFSELFNKTSYCTSGDSANNIWNCYGWSSSKQSEHECHNYCLCPKSIIEHCIPLFKDTQNQISSDFLYRF